MGRITHQAGSNESVEVISHLVGAVKPSETRRRGVLTMRVLTLHPQRRLMPFLQWLAMFGALVLGAVAPTEARITKVQITATESPTFGGYSWPEVGQYEKIVGKAFGEVDPADPQNALIADIGLRRETLTVTSSTRSTSIFSSRST
jgi:hypothetical protein